jgi:hypothetical protein
MPAQRALDSEGKPLARADGKALWNSYVEFRDKGVRDRFSDQILAALRRLHPEAFDDKASRGGDRR